MANRKKQNLVSEATNATEQLNVRAAAGDKDAMKAVTEIVTSFNALADAKDHLKKVNKDAKARSEQEFAAVKNAIEDSLPNGAGAQTVQSKLITIETAWQEYQDALALGIEEKKEAKETKKAAEKRFERAVKDSAQLALDFG